MPTVPFFQIMPDGRLRAAGIERPVEQCRKALSIMGEGLRFECGITDTHIELMIVDRHTSKWPRPLMVESVANSPSAVRAGVDRLINGFSARLGKAQHTTRN